MMKPTSINRFAALAGFAIAVPLGLLFADGDKGAAGSTHGGRDLLPAEVDGLEATLGELLERAAEGGDVSLEIDGLEAEELLDGDAGELAERLGRMLREAAQVDGEELEFELRGDGDGVGEFFKFFQGRMESRKPGRNEKDHRSALGAWKSVVRSASSATGAVLGKGDEQVALATVVDSRGYLVSKASELPDGPVTVEFGDGQQRKAKRLDVNQTWDLALLKVPGEELTAVEFARGEVDLGSFLAAPGPGGYPVATGVASVMPRNLSIYERGYLGIGMADDGDTVRVQTVQRGSAAEKAGIKPGDQVLAIDGTEIDGSAHLAELVGGRAPGEKVGIRYRRDDDVQNIEVALGKRDRPTEREVRQRERFERMQPGRQMAGRLSEMRDEFPNALQHDLTLAPEECGGPLVGLDGKAIGVNIARGGRVKSFAIPAADLKPLLGDLGSGRFAIVGPRQAQRELDEVDKEIAEMERRLERARERKEAAREALEKTGGEQ